MRELESLRIERRLTDCRVVVGQFGGLGGVARQIVRRLRARGAQVVHSDDLDASRQALAANRFEADVYIGLETATEPTMSVAYYATEGFESVGGRQLAGLLEQGLAKLSIAAGSASGMRLPILRETRMPAILCTIGPVRQVADRAPEVADAVAAAVECWIRRLPST